LCQEKIYWGGLLQENTLTVTCELNVFIGELASKKPPEISSQMTKGITFKNWVEELHYQQHPEELEKKKQKNGNMNVGLFNPIGLLHSIESWKELRQKFNSVKLRICDIKAR
jgi:hypothetical protein